MIILNLKVVISLVIDCNFLAIFNYQLTSLK
jgi:hypothetical protein